MTVCNRCGKENQDHYKFCLGCGAELTAAPKPGGVRHHRLHHGHVATWLGCTRQFGPASEAELVVVLVLFAATIADGHGGSRSDDFDAK